MTQTADVVIIGAGIIGGSIAFHLLERDPRLRVVVLEKEAEPGTGATSKATGGVRFQFSTEANVRLTQLSYRYFTHDRELLGRSVDFLRHGYLFVTTDAATLAQCRENVALQREARGGERAPGPVRDPGPPGLARDRRPARGHLLRRRRLGRSVLVALRASWRWRGAAACAC